MITLASLINIQFRGGAAAGVCVTPFYNHNTLSPHAATTGAVARVQ